MIERRGGPARRTPVEAPGARLGDLHRNGWRPVLVVNEAQFASQRAAGGDAVRMFSPAAADTPGERRGRVPRRLSTLATQSLFVGAMRSHHQIDAELVRDVADDQE